LDPVEFHMDIFLFNSVYITVADVRKQLPLPFLHESMFTKPVEWRQ